MKHIKTCTYLFILFFSAGLYSCEDMMDIHEKYIKSGETVYLVKPDSVVALPGNGRVLIKFILKNAYNVNKIWVYWNNGNDSASYEYSMKNYIDSVSLLITGLEEKSYIFDLYTKNSDGNRSVKVTTFAASYGKRYIASLNPRMISSFSVDTANCTLNWLAGEETEYYSEVKYTKTDGRDTILRINPDTSSVVLPYFSDQSDIRYRSFFKPEPKVIDLFETDWTTYEFPATYKLFQSIRITPKAGGVDVSWNNPQNITVSVKVQYLSNLGISLTRFFKVSPSSITGLSSELREFKVTVTDASGNVFGPKIFRVTPL